MDYKEIAAKLLKAFESSDYSYGELSKITGIPKSALQRYITGDTGKIPMDRLRIICEKLGLDVAELLGWDESPPHDDPPEPDQPGVKRIISLAHQYPDMPPEMRAYIDGFLDSMFIKLDGQFKKGSAEDDPKL